MKTGTLDGAALLNMDSGIVMKMTMFLDDKSKALTDIIVSSNRLAARAVAVAFTSNMSDPTMAMHLGVEATADMPKDTNAILTEKRSWRAKPVVACYIGT